VKPPECATTKAARGVPVARKLHHVAAIWRIPPTSDTDSTVSHTPGRLLPLRRPDSRLSAPWGEDWWWWPPPSPPAQGSGAPPSGRALGRSTGPGGVPGSLISL